MRHNINIEIDRNQFKKMLGIKDGKDGVGVRGATGPEGPRGPAGSPDSGAQIVRKINSLELLPDLMIDARHIKNLTTVVPMGGPGINPGMFRGIGLWSTPAETPAADGSVTAFTVGSTAPTDVIADGVVYYAGQGYTYSGGRITFNIGGAGPTQYVRYR